MIEQGKREPGVTAFGAFVQIALGDFESGLGSLERAKHDGVRPTPIWFNYPFWDSYRRDPRFASVLQSTGYIGTALLTRGAPSPELQ